MIVSSLYDSAPEIWYELVENDVESIEAECSCVRYEVSAYVINIVSSLMHLSDNAETNLQRSFERF